MAIPKLVIICWSGANWSWMNPYLDSGALPNLERLVNEGVISNCSVPRTSSRDHMWAQLLSGRKTVHGATPNSHTEEDSELSIYGREQTDSFFDVLATNGKRIVIVGRWGTTRNSDSPLKTALRSNSEILSSRSVIASKEIGVSVANIVKFSDQESFVSKNCARNDLRGHSTDPLSVQQSIAIGDDARRINSIALKIAKSECWDVLALHLGTFRKIAGAKQLNHVDRKLIAAQALFRCDTFLGELRRSIGNEPTILIFSERGVNLEKNSDTQRPFLLEYQSVSDRFGIVAICGARVRKDVRIYGASIFDIFPTITRLAGVPLPLGLAGRCLTQALNPEPDKGGQLQRRHKFGGVSPHTGVAERIWKHCRRIANTLYDVGCYSDAGVIYASLLQQKPQCRFSLARLFFSLHATGKNEEANIHCTRIFKNEWNMETQVRSMCVPYSDAIRSVVSRVRLLTNKTNARREKYIAELKVLECIAMQIRRETESLGDLSFINDIQDQHLLIRMARLSIALNNWVLGKQCIETALRMRKESVIAHLERARFYFLQMDYTKAMDAVMRSIGLQHFNPTAHFFRGEMETRAGRPDLAHASYMLCIQQNPYHLPAYSSIERTRPFIDRGNGKVYNLVTEKIEAHVALVKSFLFNSRTKKPFQ